MKKSIIVSTRSKVAFNADGQHDCAGTWVIVPSKNEGKQIAAAEGIEYLIHRKDGEMITAYQVVGFHTERRDYVFRQGTPQDPNGQPKISIGIRFHLRTVDDATKAYLIDGANTFISNGGVVQGCSVVEL